MPSPRGWTKISLQLLVKNISVTGEIILSGSALPGMTGALDSLPSAMRVKDMKARPKSTSPLLL